MQSTDFDSTSKRADLSSQATLFAVLWAVTLLFDRAVRGATLDPFSLGITATALVLLLKPRAAWRLALLATAHLVWLVWIAPDTLHVHWYLDGVVNVAILGAWAHAAMSRREARVPMDALLVAFGPAGRAILLIALLFTGFAKLNTSFLDPASSCAASLYDFQRERFPFSFLPDVSWAKQGAIVLAVATELGVPILLLLPRLRWIGIALAYGFFLLIGTNPQAQLYEFSSAFLSLLVLFFPPSLPREVIAWLQARWPAVLLGSALRRPWFRRCAALIALLTALYFTVVADRNVLARNLRATGARFVYMTGLLAIAASYFAGRLRLRLAEPSTRALFSGGPRWLMAICVLFFAHEATVYLGFKHMPSLSMAANLKIEPGISNHVIVREPPALETNRVARLVRSSAPELRANGRTGILWLALQDYLARHPDTQITFELNGRVEALARAGDDARFSEPSWLAAMLTRRSAGSRFGLPWVFSIDQRPKQCHHRVDKFREQERKRRRRLERARAKPWAFLRLD